MIIELRKKSQITIPKKIIHQLNLQENDQLEISIQDGIILIEPIPSLSEIIHPKIRRNGAEIQKRFFKI
jgi:AbrB family looped-hinge helix DNA binding protein